MYGCAGCDKGLGAGFGAMVDTIILPDGTPITIPVLRADTPAVTGQPEPVFTTRYGQPYTMEEIVVTAEKPKTSPLMMLLPLALLGFVLMGGR